MKIVQYYSHLNGLEYLLVHHKKLWKEIQTVIAEADAVKCKTKVSKEKTMIGKLLYSPVEMNKVFCSLLHEPRGTDEEDDSAKKDATTSAFTPNQRRHTPGGCSPFEPQAAGRSLHQSHREENRNQHRNFVSVLSQ